MAKVPLIEYAVDSVDHAVAARNEGAGRIELCARLDLEGLTPPLDDVREARRRLDVPFVTMIRPHSGGHCYSAGEVALLREQARSSLEEGAGGIVVGALNDDFTINRAAVRSLVALAGGRDVAFHRAFDEVADQAEALETLIACGVRRVLTSGRATTALEGAARIRDLVTWSAGRVVVVACGRIRADSLEEVVRLTGVSEVHRRYVAPSDGSR